MTAVANTGSMLVDILRPSFFNKETEEVLRLEADDVAEVGVTAFEWAHVFTGSEYAHESAETLETVEQVLALPAFVKRVGDTRNSFVQWQEGTGKFTEVVQNGLMTVNKAAKSSFFFNSIDLIQLKDNLKVARGIFWSTLGVVDTIEVVANVSKLGALNDQYSKTTNAEEKNILNHRWYLTGLNIVKSVNCIAQAAIALVSILFVSLAHGIIFSPIVFLGLTTSWLILNFGTHFYGKFIKKWAAEIEPKNKA